MKGSRIFSRWGAGRAILFVFLLFESGAAHGDMLGAARYSAQHGERALLVWRNGRLQFERYSPKGAPDRPEHIFSITKSLCALGTFAAISRGVLQLDEPVSATLTEWRRDPRKRKITVRDLLSQTSGLSPGFEEIYAPKVRDKNRRALALPTIAPPGAKFDYGPSHYEVLEALLARKLGGSPLAWMERALFGPLGIRPGGWRRDRVGNPFFSAGAQVSARDLLAAGHLVRRHGWIFLFPLIPPSLMRDATSGSRANPTYGLGFWLNSLASDRNATEIDVEEAISHRSSWSGLCLSKSAPSDLVAMVGSRGQRVYVSPSERLVVVRLGTESGFRDPDFLRRFFR